VKDPEHRKQVTSSYLDLLQKGLSKAQESVTKYQEKVAPKPPADETPAADPPTPPTETT
jgi:hypothetical protein